jgi:hypothetical protein
METPVSDESDMISIEPWPVSELAGHLVTQLTLGRRALIERDTAAEQFERETDRFELESWARLELTPWMTANELDLLTAGVGTLDDSGLEACERGLLVGSTIAWALHLTRTDHLPAPTDGQIELAMLEWAPTPWTSVRSIVKSLRVRSDECLAFERERWEILAWRLSLFSDPTTTDEDTLAWHEAVPEIEEAGLWPITSGDLSLVHGKSIGDLDTSDSLALLDEAETRLRALNWTCGFGERPTTAPLDLDTYEGR